MPATLNTHSSSNSALPLSVAPPNVRQTQIDALHKLTNHLVSVREKITLILEQVTPSSTEKILHPSEKPPYFGVWKTYHSALDEELNSVEKAYDKMKSDLNHLKEKHKLELDKLRNDNERLSSQNVQFQQEIEGLRVELAFFTNRRFASKQSQCSLIDPLDIQRTEDELHQLKNKSKDSKSVDATVKYTNQSSLTDPKSTCESFAQATTKMTHVGVCNSTVMVHQEVQHERGRMVDKAIGKPVKSEAKSASCMLLDHNKVRLREEQLSQEIHLLTHIPRSEKSVEANLVRETQDAIIECTLHEEIQHHTVNTNSKDVQSSVSVHNRSVSCAPDTSNVNIQIVPVASHVSLQVQMPKLDKGVGIEPEQWDSAVQFHSPSNHIASQIEPTIRSVKTETHVEVKEQGMVCIIFTEEIACQCNLLVESQPPSEDVQLSQEFSEDDEALHDEPGAPQNLDTPTEAQSESSSDGPRLFNTIGKKRKARPTFCELCNIHFSSTDELQLHQEACHTKRQRTQESDEVHANEECDICMLDLFDGNPMYRLRNCAHYFHLHCVYRCLLSRSIPNRCVRCFTDIADAENARIDNLVMKVDQAKSQAKKGSYEDYTVYEYEE